MIVAKVMVSGELEFSQGFSKDSSAPVADGLYISVAVPSAGVTLSLPELDLIVVCPVWRLGASGNGARVQSECEGCISGDGIAAFHLCRPVQCCILTPSFSVTKSKQYPIDLKAEKVGFRSRPLQRRSRRNTTQVLVV